MRRLILMLSIIGMLTACDQNLFEPVAQELVVEGWIEDGEPPIVLLTLSLPATEEKQYLDSLSDLLVRWATVTVSDGEQSVILTGKYAPGYYPPYIYTTGQMFGKTGGHYTLKVEYGNYLVTAETDIPASPVIDEYRVEKVAGSDTLYQITAQFTDNPDERNYYQIFTRVGKSKRQYSASLLGTISDENLKGSVSVPVYRGRTIMKQGEEYNPYFALNDTVAVKFSQQSAMMYEFWNSMQKNLTLSDNFFFSYSSNLPSNITGGIGYWAGYGSSVEYFIIGEAGRTHLNARQTFHNKVK